MGPNSHLLMKIAKINDGLSVLDLESGFPDSGPDSIHGRPGLRKHVAFSVPLHSNNACRFWCNVVQYLARGRKPYKPVVHEAFRRALLQNGMKCITKHYVYWSEEER